MGVPEFAHLKCGTFKLPISCLPLKALADLLFADEWD